MPEMVPEPELLVPGDPEPGLELVMPEPGMMPGTEPELERAGGSEVVAKGVEVIRDVREKTGTDGTEVSGVRRKSGHRVSEVRRELEESYKGKDSGERRDVREKIVPEVSGVREKSGHRVRGVREELEESYDRKETIRVLTIGSDVKTINGILFQCQIID